MIDLEKKHQEIIHNILSKYLYKFYAYGSRVKGTARKLSDLDICYYDNVAGYEVEEIRELLEKSDLSFIVEIVN